MADKLKGVLGGEGASAVGELAADADEAVEEDASVDAMRAYMKALKGDDAAAALEAFRTLQLAEG